MATTSLPPGFRFHPTDVELVLYYLKRKVLGKPLSIEALTELDLYKFEPWDLPEKSCLRSKDLVWYFFCPRDRKYANGPRTNRATGIGYWKTTGRDRTICNDSQTVGMKKTLIFHIGRAPQGSRTNWVMHEYRLDIKNWVDLGISQDSYVLCKIFEKSGPGPKNGEQHGAPFREEEWEDHTVDRSFAPVPHPDSGSPSIIVDDEKISAAEDMALVLGKTCNESSLKHYCQNDSSNGRDQNDSFNGGDQNDSFNGGDQNDSFNGGHQNDLFNGGDQHASSNGRDQNGSSNGGDQNGSSNGGDQNDSSNGNGENLSLIQDVDTDSTTSNEENDLFCGQKINNEATCISALLALKTSTSLEDREERLGIPEVISKRKTGKRSKKFRPVF